MHSRHEGRLGRQCAPPSMYFDPIIARMTTVFPCILCQRLQMRLDGHFCALHAVAGILRSVCLTYRCPCYTANVNAGSALSTFATVGAGVYSRTHGFPTTAST